MSNQKTSNPFSINASTYTLKTKNNEEDKIIIDGATSYLIPIYQRPYSWTEEQIKKLIKDRFISYWGSDKKSSPEPIFIGTMQLSGKKENGKQEIIDGQQRISTFVIILKILSLKFPAAIKFDDCTWLSTKVNNGKEQEKLMELYKCQNLSDIISVALNNFPTL